ncbi:MAG: MFS transporter [Elusimicrobia bacterium]|nr:MFS transporter [Elusimicrobiota bacterium]
MLKKALAVLVLSALLWSSGPLPAFAARAVAPSAAAGTSASWTGPAGLGPSQAGVSRPVLDAAPVSWAAPTLGTLPSAPAVRSVSASVLPAAPALSPLPLLAAPAAQTPLAVAAEPAAVTAAEGLQVLSEKLAPDQTSSPAEAEKSGALNKAFDGSGLKSRAEAAAVSDPVMERPSAARPQALAPAAGTSSALSQAPGTPAPEQPAGRIPISYYLYLAGQFLYALGQEATSLIAPLYAYSAQGLAFAVATQAAFLVAILPGSFLGAKWVQRFDAKKVYLAGNLLHGLMALSVPVLHVLTGAFSPWHFLASNIAAGFIYGSLRGVAEKEIAPRIMGQEDRGRLNKAGALFYAAFEGAELVAALVIGAAIPLLGLNPTAAIMSAVMLSSVVPIWFMKLKKAGSAEEETGGTEKKLPKMLYLPYIFSLFSHLSLYMFLAPFLALEVFHKAALNSSIVAFYTVGSLVVALATAYAPKLTGKLSEKGWAAAGVASMLAFLAASLVLQNPILTMAAAFALGIGLTGMQVQWRSLYQQRLDIGVQPGIFKWLSVVGVLATLPPFAFIQAGLFMGWSMPLLLTVTAAAIAVVSLGVPLASWLIKRLKPKA